MENEIYKSVKDSYTEQVHILTQADMNGFGRLFGGTLMSWIDITSAVVARRHCNKNVTTAYVSEVEFKAPARANDLVLMTGKLTYVGNSSMEVCVDAFVEERCGNKKHIGRAYVVLVALDDNDMPVRVPRLKVETDEERKEWEAGERRHRERAMKKSRE